MSTLIPRTRTTVHPFRIDLVRQGKDEFLAVNYHSRLFKGMTLNEEYLSFDQTLSITGLDFLEPVPTSFPGKNFYCVLEVEISNLQPIKANIVWVEGDSKVDDLNPVVFQSTTDLSQVKSRTIIGIYVFDGEQTAGTLSPDLGGSKTGYITQFVHSDLMICNMVFDGVPVILPVPFVGGRLNANLF
jgi:hypothetical protein